MARVKTESPYKYYKHPYLQKEGKIRIYCRECGQRLRANFHYKSDDGIKYLHRLKTGHNSFVSVNKYA